MTLVEETVVRMVGQTAAYWALRMVVHSGCPTADGMVVQWDLPSVEQKVEMKGDMSAVLTAV